MRMAEKKSRKKKSKKKKEYVFVTGKRKSAVARAKVVPGSGKIYINSRPLNVWGNERLRLWIKEPILLAGDVGLKFDFDITAKGGGIVSQAEAIRMAIAKGLIEITGDKKLKEKFLQYDRGLLIYDPRRNEPHHAGGASKRGSRRHKQRSKR